MSHLHTLISKPQIYTLLLEGDDKYPFYIYIGATECFTKRWSQHLQGHEAYTAGKNDGWSTPKFTRCCHKPLTVLELQFVDNPGQAEYDTFLKWFHILGRNFEQVRGADWCQPPKLSWESCKRIGGQAGPTLRKKYDEWVARGLVTQAESIKDNLLALPGIYIQQSPSAKRPRHQVEQLA